jgi:predicted metal-dependent hydrolase
MLGHHDENHSTIVISLSLDDRSVPDYVVEFVLFHEILHIVYPTRIVGGRRQIHSPEFRRHERTFRFYDAAEAWIERNAGALRRKAKRSLF